MSIDQDTGVNVDELRLPGDHRDPPKAAVMCKPSSFENCENVGFWKSGKRPTFCTASTACPDSAMVVLDALTFDDPSLESAFRCHWEAMAQSLVALLSLLTGAIWAVALFNIDTHCRWSRALCLVVELICCSAVAAQLYFQVIFRSAPNWRAPELNKAYVFLADLTASMVFVMLVRDLQEVPGGTHVWVYTCHGWAILFLQVTSVSAFHLHALNLFAYVILETYISYEFGLPSSLAGGFGSFLTMFTLCGMVPFAANVCCELLSRKAFLNRCGGAHPVVQRQWLASL